MHFTRGDVRDHIVSSKSITDLRRGIEKRRIGTEVQRSTFGLFDFRVLPTQSGRSAEISRALRALLADATLAVKSDAKTWKKGPAGP